MVEPVLFVACHDFDRVAKGMPIELQVYEAWWLSKQDQSVSIFPFSTQDTLRRNKQRFMSIRRMSRDEQLRLGQRRLDEAKANPKLEMYINREVSLPAVTATPARSSERR